MCWLNAYEYWDQNTPQLPKLTIAWHTYHNSEVEVYYEQSEQLYKCALIIREEVLGLRASSRCPDSLWAGRNLLQEMEKV